MKRTTNQRGFTLVEAIVGAAVFSICALILVTGFTAAGSMIRKGMDIKNKSEKAETAIENAGSSSDIQTSQKDGSLAFSLDGNTITVNGQYMAAEDNSGNEIYTEFKPNS